MGQLVVHPACDLPYSSFVLEGLTELVGPSSIVYSTEGFDRKFAGGRVPRVLHRRMNRARDVSCRCTTTPT